MKAVNLTTSPVELDPENGPGMLAPAILESEGAHERDLEKVTDRERALADAGLIALLDTKGRRQNPDPPPPPPLPPGAESADPANGGDA